MFYVNFERIEMFCFYSWRIRPINKSPIITKGCGAAPNIYNSSSICMGKYSSFLCCCLEFSQHRNHPIRSLWMGACIVYVLHFAFLFITYYNIKWLVSICHMCSIRQLLYTSKTLLYSVNDKLMIILMTLHNSWIEITIIMTRIISI